VLITSYVQSLSAHADHEGTVFTVRLHEKVAIKQKYGLDDMTLKLDEGDRIYKIIEARTFGNTRKRIISKMDKSRKITALTYTFNDKDIKEDGTIDNKEMMMLVKEMDEDRFKQFININYQVYPGFKILWEKNYSDKSLEEATTLMNLEFLSYD